MYISYEEFLDLVSNYIHKDEEFYLELLNNLVDNPTRYFGLFRLSNPKIKLVQNITQSREIKFGDIVEELTTEYLSKLGYENFDKNLGKDENGDFLNVDQYYTDGNVIYMVEMKIRDDHDSTKKRGQYFNFQKKIRLISQKNPGKVIDACMWFVDDGLIKNKKYYKEQMENDISNKTFENASLHLYYGNEYFHTLKNGDEAWEQFINNLTEYRLEHSKNDVEIPDFGTSTEIFKALLLLSDSEWKKLNSNLPEYCLLREELFHNGDNLKKAAEIRNK